MEDGQVERLNRNFISILKTLSSESKSNWKQELPKLAFSYNSTICKSTGFSPFYLMFGRHSRLLIDLMFGTDDLKDEEQYSEFVRKWKESLQSAIKVASET